MSRANISFGMRQLCKVFWHPLKKTAHFVCKRCANIYSKRSQLQKHKLTCSLDFDKQYRHRHALKGESYLSQNDVEAALSALRIEVPQLKPIEQRIATRERVRPLRFISVSSPSSSIPPPSKKSKRIEAKEQEGHHSTKTLAVKAFLQYEKLSQKYPIFKMESAKDSDYGSGESIFGDTDSDGSFSSDFSYFSAQTGISELSPDSTDNVEEGAGVDVGLDISNHPFPLEYIVIEGEEELKEGETFLLVDCEGLNEEDYPSEVNYGLNNLSLSEPDLDATLPIGIDLDHLELGALETVEHESFTTNAEVKVKIEKIEKKPFSEAGPPSRKRKIQDSPLFKSVLEKTLFVSIKRCDKLVKNKMPKLEQIRDDEQSNVNVPDDESWDVIPSQSSDSDSGTPIKLKIKRRPLKSEKDDGQQNIKKSNTSSAKFFKGVCSCCGSKTSFEDSSTYYKKNNPEDNENNLFCCCTCYNTFGQGQWDNHNRECCTLEEIEAGVCDDEENPIIYGMEMKRDFVCSICFKSMSNC